MDKFLLFLTGILLLILIILTINYWKKKTAYENEINSLRRAKELDEINIQKMKNDIDNLQLIINKLKVENSNLIRQINNGKYR